MIIKPKDLGEKLLYSTVLIETQSKDKKTYGTGTGFLYRFEMQNEKKPIVIMVTNKHVVKDIYSCRLKFHIAEKKEDVFEPSGKYEEYTFSSEEMQGIWHFHPDKDVDLCGMFMGYILKKFKDEGKEIYAQPFYETMILSDEELYRQYSAIEDIIMIGYPNSLYDAKNNFPLIRKGITASHPAIDFDGKPMGMVDIASFPGSSGSPIMIYKNGPQKKNNALVMCETIVLLGVLYAGPTFSAKGEIVLKEIPTTKTEIMMHLGSYVKAKELALLQKTMIETALKAEQIKINAVKQNEVK